MSLGGGASTAVDDAVIGVRIILNNNFILIENKIICLTTVLLT